MFVKLYCGTRGNIFIMPQLLCMLRLAIGAARAHAPYSAQILARDLVQRKLLEIRKELFEWLKTNGTTIWI